MSQATRVRPLSSASSRFGAHDARLPAVLGDAARLAKLADVDAHEGPVYAGDEDALYFTTVPRWRPEGPQVAIRRLDLATGEQSVLRADANAANGMALDRDGHLVVCEQGSLTRPAAITRVDRTAGRTATVVDAWGEVPLNSPNDVVVASDGTLWFTDPGYGHLQGFRPRPRAGDHVYRFDPAADRLTVVADSFDKPNGLAFSPDERTLYVADSGAPRHVKAFDVVDGERLAGRRVFARIAPGAPDGLAVDSEGRVYATCATGVQVFAPEGDPLGEIPVPGAVNLTFGGRDRAVLFVTADVAIWAARLHATGPLQPRET